ncbi:MAG: hypothetical protein Q7T82_11560 [Armatimonadota bacterium]|nr:hypothetical protein [Armatimonadota bacterium]
MERERDELPINLERLREQWKELGLVPDETYRPQRLTAGRIDFDEEPIEVAAVFDNDDYQGGPRRTVRDVIESLRQELEETKDTFAKELRQTKESHLLELRSLKGLTLDLASLVYELTEEMKKDRARRPWYRIKKK